LLDESRLVMTVADATDHERFEISVGGEVVGFAEYHRTASAISFLHTEIDPAYAGEGLGTQLISAALDATREEGKPVLPYCPFVRHFIRTHPQYVDLVPERRRASFGLGEEAA
jgi:predicted GNAT family acetyltransferase